jgi:hypothetical protein
MTDPVFVIHGIGTRERADFEAMVAKLSRAIGGVEAHPVFWGDLGAQYRLINDTVPVVGGPRSAEELRDGAEELRDGAEDAATPAAPDLGELLIGGAAGIKFRNGDGPAPQVVIDAAVGNLVNPEGEEIREDAPAAGAVRAAITEHWSATAWLQRVSDPALLAAVGAGLTGPMAEPPTALPPTSGAEIRDEELRGLDVGGFIKRRMDELDRVVGAAFGAAGGRLNTHLRSALLPGITRYAGDILVYQHQRKVIQQRVRDVIEVVDPALGRDADHPVDIAAHSLGGVITVDMATADDPLWVRSLVTFGSQSSFVHICDPRGGQLQPFDGSSLVQLPPSLGSWTNLWEPLDLLAFIAAKVFQLHDGTPPDDRAVAHLSSSGLWTHSAYWDLPDVAKAIGGALRSRGSPGPMRVRAPTLIAASAAQA